MQKKQTIQIDRSMDSVTSTRSFERSPAAAAAAEDQPHPNSSTTAARTEPAMFPTAHDTSDGAGTGRPSPRRSDAAQSSPRRGDAAESSPRRGGADRLS